MTTAVFIFYTDTWQALADIVLPVAARYCERHGYAPEFYCDNDYGRLVHTDSIGCFNVHKTMPVGYHKMVKLRELMNKYDLIWVLDCDALITNEEIPFTDFVPKVHSMFFTEDVHGLNAGSWIIRKTNWSKRILNSVIANFDAPEEQTVLKAELNKVFKRDGETHAYIIRHPSINSYLYSEYLPEWNDKVGDGIEMPDHAGGNWEPGDLCLHLPGLTLERRIEVFTEIIKTL